MTKIIRPHITSRRGFIAATGFGGVSLYGLWAAYGAAPGPLALLGLDHADGLPHQTGDGNGVAAVSMEPSAAPTHGAHGGAASRGPDPAEFSNQSAAFSERFRLPDGRVYPRRITTTGAGTDDPHAEHVLAAGAMAMASAPPTDAHASGSGQTSSTSVKVAEPIDVLMTAGKWFYLPNALLLDVGQRYRFRMMALDVSHGASIQFGRGGRMMRLQPGRVTEAELSFARPGRYLLHCAVYCGEAHDVMQASIEVA